jgi:thymidylate kinase
MRSLHQKDGGASRATYRSPEGPCDRNGPMPRRGQIVAIEGPSGAGKSTVARTAARAFGWVPLDEATHRLDPPPSLRFRSDEALLSLERTLLAEEGRRYREAVGQRRLGRTVLVDTGFLGPLTYTAALVVLGDASPRVFARLRSLVVGPERLYRIGLPDRIVYLDVPARVRRRHRNQDRHGHPREFEARHEVVARVERRFYRDLARGPLARRVRFVSGVGSPRIVAARVRAAVRSPGVPLGSRATLRDVLARLADGVRDRPTARRKPLARHR